jgi:hypothetical protein
MGGIWQACVSYTLKNPLLIWAQYMMLDINRDFWLLCLLSFSLLFFVWVAARFSSPKENKLPSAPLPTLAHKFTSWAWISKQKMNVNTTHLMGGERERGWSLPKAMILLYE